jgi:hypothetical protein
MIIYFDEHVLRMQKSEANGVNNSIEDYYTSNRAHAIINHKLKIVFVEYKDNLTNISVSVT